MPIFLSSFIIPAGTPFAIEDKYMRGGYMVLSDIAERDSLHSMNKKPGMLVFISDTKEYWQLQDDKTTWSKPDFGSVEFGDSFTTDENGKITLDVPTSAAEGQALVLDSNKKPIWAAITEGGGAVSSYTGPERYTENVSTASIPAGGSEDLVLNLAKTCILLDLTINHPDIEVAIHSTDSRNDKNPYRFLSESGHLSDDGTSRMDDGTLQYNRRYAILANLESTVSNKLYVRVTNKSSEAKTVTLDISYLRLEE